MAMEVAGPPPPDVLNNLRIFLSGAKRNRQVCDLELTRNALSLLKTMPASRDGVLDYLCIVFDQAVQKYSAQAKVTWFLRLNKKIYFKLNVFREIS